MRNPAKFKSLWFCNSRKWFYTPPGTLSSALLKKRSNIYFHDHEWNKSQNGDVGVLTSTTAVNATHPNNVLLISCPLSYYFSLITCVYLVISVKQVRISVSNALPLLAQLFIQKMHNICFPIAMLININCGEKMMVKNRHNIASVYITVMTFSSVI